MLSWSAFAQLTDKKKKKKKKHQQKKTRWSILSLHCNLLMGLTRSFTTDLNSWTIHLLSWKKILLVGRRKVLIVLSLRIHQNHVARNSLLHWKAQDFHCNSEKLGSSSHNCCSCSSLVAGEQQQLVSWACLDPSSMKPPLSRRPLSFFLRWRRR